MRRSQQHHPMVDIMQYQLEASIHLANAVFSSTERIDRAMLDVTHEAVDRQLKFVRAAADFRDPSKAAEFQVALSGRPEKAMHYQQEIMSALVDLQVEFGKSMRNCMERCSEVASLRLTEASAETGAALPEGGMANPFAGVMSVWEQAFRQASQLASQNMLMASSSAENVANLAREAAGAGNESTAGNGHGHGHGHQAARAHEEHATTRRQPRRK